ncbi:hypothetical protein LCGC14_1663700 [marine sediment metagenome]|uniref:Uncharacterized protein n=1 Tax=marine sediment metagenome TaxID=412755 RepID=A0A0F9IFX9_9ZZZZ|nr:hypothetical protein [bacterium]
MTKYQLGDEEYIEEVNTSYDQEQDIGDTPSHYPAAGAEPIDAETGDDFLDIEIGGEEPKIEESLNKDGTGVQHATRGINPNDPKYDLMKFVYVSKSNCPTCKQYDGKVFHKDDPDRPIIPRLESGYESGDGYAGSNYTHPHCKCKWVYVFNRVGEVRAEEIKQSTYDRVRKWYSGDFDSLTSLEQKTVIIDMFKQSLAGEMEEADEFDLMDPVPLLSIAKIAFDAIEPTIKQKIGVETVGLDNNWDEKTLPTGYQDPDYEDTGFTNDDLELARDQMNYEINNPIAGGHGWQQKGEGKAEEGGKGSGKMGHQKWMLGGEAGEECGICMIITDKDDDGKCILCGN